MMMSKAPKYTRRQIHLAQAITTVAVSYTHLLGSASVSDEYICRYVGITPSELQMARKVEAMQARKSTRLNSSPVKRSRMPSSA